MSDKRNAAPEQRQPTDVLESVWFKNKKFIAYIIVGVIAVAGGIFAYQSYVVKPRAERAAAAIFTAQNYFAVDSFRLALNGDGINKGFLYIINNYGATKEGNLAKYYAGISYLKLGEFDNAVKYLKDFSTDAKQIQMMAYGALGDALSEQGKSQEAIDSYKKAAGEFPDDEFNSSEYLFRAGLLNETMGKTKEAVDIYKDLKKRFPKTDKGFNIDKYIYRLEVQANDFSVK